MSDPLRKLVFIIIYTNIDFNSIFFNLFLWKITLNYEKNGFNEIIYYKYDKNYFL